MGCWRWQLAWYILCCRIHIGDLIILSGWMNAAAPYPRTFGRRSRRASEEGTTRNYIRVYISSGVVCQDHQKKRVTFSDKRFGLPTKEGMLALFGKSQKEPQQKRYYKHTCRFCVLRFTKRQIERERER